ncbi:MAG: SpoIIE family protein phosphatase [Mycobacteriales bacterium]
MSVAPAPKSAREPAALPLRLLDALVDAAPCVAVLHGPDHEMVFCNTAFQEIFGSPDPGVPGATGYPGLAAQGFFACADAVLRSGQSLTVPEASVQRRVRRPGGLSQPSPDERRVTVSMTPLGTASAEPYGVLVCAVEVGSETGDSQRVAELEEEAGVLTALVEEAEESARGLRDRLVAAEAAAAAAEAAAAAAAEAAAAETIAPPDEAPPDEAPPDEAPPALEMADLRRDRRRYARLVESASSILWVADVRGLVTEDCPGWRDYTGQQPEEFLGRGWLDAVHPDDRDQVRRSWREGAERGSPYEVTYRVRGRDGSYRRFVSRGVPVRDVDAPGEVDEEDPAGTVLEWVGTCSDVEDTLAAQERMLFAQQAASLVSSSLEAAEVLERLGALTVPLLGDWCVIYLPEPDGQLHRRYARHVDPGRDQQLHELLDLPPFPASAGNFVARVFRTGQPEVALDTASSGIAALVPEPGYADLIDTLGASCGLAVPFRSAGRTLGVIAFSRGPGRPSYTEVDLALARDVAARAALALQHAHQYDHERRTAELLQQSLLPTLAELPDAELAACYVPGGEGSHVGGDWYDAVDLGGGSVGLVVGDVMGRGVHAAAVMGQLRAAVRAYARLGMSPGEVLRQLGQLASDISPSEIATCLYAVYDAPGHRLVLANAGHPPPLLRDPGGRVLRLGGEPGPPLGTGDWLYDQRLYDVPSGGVLAFYTDGLIESRDRDIEDGMAELAEVLASEPAEDLEVTGRAILRRLGREQGHDDDVALLLMRPVEEERSPGWLVNAELPAEPAGVAPARQVVTEALRAALGERVSADLVFAVQEITSELLTNAVRYGLPPIRLRLRLLPTAVHVEIADAGLHQPVPRRPLPTDEGGRGLQLVAALARRWGTRSLPRGKAVWAEIARR